MTTVYRVEVTLPMTTDLPRDVSMNTFHVAQGGAPGAGYSDAGSDIIPAITAFYNDDAGTDGAICTSLSSVLSRTELCTIKGYDLHDVKPRPVRFLGSFTLGASGTSGFDLPNQCTAVASLLSTHTDLFSGDLLPLPNRRGRVFLGPLRSSVLTFEGANSVFMPTFRQSVADQCQSLAGVLGELETSDDSDTSHFAWVVLSLQTAKVVRSMPGASPIGRGWVDNAIDTQRSRVERATSRTSWSL